MHVRPSYWQVFLTFARNSLVRDIMFRMNFVLQCISSISWTLMNVGFYLIVFTHTDMIGPESGWGSEQYLYAMLGDDPPEGSWIRGANGFALIDYCRAAP